MAAALLVQLEHLSMALEERVNQGYVRQDAGLIQTINVLTAQYTQDSNWMANVEQIVRQHTTSLQWETACLVLVAATPCLMADHVNQINARKDKPSQ